MYRHAEVPQWLMDEMQNGDAAAAISNAALADKDELCVETLQRFVRLYGAEAGNLSLKTMSRAACIWAAASRRRYCRCCATAPSSRPS